MGAKSEAQMPSSAAPMDGFAGEARSREASPNSMPRQIIRRGDITLRVTNVEESEKQVAAMVTKAGGYIEGTSSSDLDSSRPQITITARVPSNRFGNALESLKSLGIRRSLSISTDDVTSQVIDLDARIRNMKAQEVTLRELLKRATKLADVIALTDRLSNLRGEIESIEGQRKDLAQQAAMSTLTIRLEQGLVAGKEKDPNWFEQGFLEAVNSLGGFLRSALVFMIWVAVFSPIWGGVWLLIRRFRANR